MNFADHVALITGAGSGIGRAIAHTLDGLGLNLMLVGRTIAKLEAVQAELTNGSKCQIQACDVADRSQTHEIVQRTRDQFGRLDVLICNAGTNVVDRSLAKLTPENWDKMIATNLTGAFNLVHAALPLMREQKRGGLIVQISSIAGYRPFDLAGTGYSASKYGQSALGMGIGMEEGVNGIRSTVIYPGEVETPILDERPVPVPQDRRDQILQPEDVASAVRFLVELDPRARIPHLVITPTVDSWS